MRSLSWLRSTHEQEEREFAARRAVIDAAIATGYRNVLNIDNSVLQGTRDVEWILRARDDDGTYAGHVFAWPDSSTSMSLIGIRRSLFLPEESRGFASQMINLAIAFAKSRGYSSLRIEAPLAVMKPVLRRRGFVARDVDYVIKL